jgi:fructokinase
LPGEDALVELARHGVEAGLVERRPDRPTGRVLVTLDGAGQPSYEISAGSAWDDMTWRDDLLALAVRCDAACFGTLGQRSAASREVIRRFLRSTRPGALRVFDVNLRQEFHDAALVRESLSLANVLKLNEEELPVVATYCGTRSAGLDALREIARRYELRLVALTRGECGSVLIAGRDEHECLPPQTAVVDTVGAGDAFTAALVLGLLRGLPLEAIHRHAGAVAAFVCSVKGATPALPESLRRLAPAQSGGM